MGSSCLARPGISKRYYPVGDIIILSETFLAITYHENTASNPTMAYGKGGNVLLMFFLNFN